MNTKQDSHRELSIPYRCSCYRHSAGQSTQKNIEAKISLQQKQKRISDITYAGLFLDT